MTSHSKVLMLLKDFECKRLKIRSKKRYFSEVALRMQATMKLKCIDFLTIDSFDKGERCNVYEIKTESGSYDSRFFDAMGKLHTATIAA